MKIRRRGYTLVEMSVVIALGAIILSMVASLLTVLYRTESHFRYDGQHRQSMQRLAVQLRQDAHAAANAEIVDGDEKNKIAQSLLFSLPKGYTVRYKIEKRRITRTKRLQDAVVHRDSFRLGAGFIVEMKKIENDSLPIVVVKITSRPLDIPELEPIDVDLIEAAVGINHRYSLPEKP